MRRSVQHCERFGLRLLEDIVRADPAPHDVRFARGHLGAVLERGSPVGSPCHLEDSSRTLNRLDPQSFAEPATTLQIVDELLYRGEKRSLLRWRQALKVDAESRQPGVGRHDRLAGAPPLDRLGDRLQSGHQRVA
jgi:hypothetical protein